MANQEKTLKKPSDLKESFGEGSRPGVTDEDIKHFITYKKCFEEGARRMEAKMNKLNGFPREELVVDWEELDKVVKEINRLHSRSVDERVAVAVGEVGLSEGILRWLKEENARLIQRRDCLGTVRGVRKGEKQLESRVVQLKSVLEKTVKKIEELDKDISGLTEARDERVEKLRKMEMEVKRLEKEMKEEKERMVKKMMDSF